MCVPRTLESCFLKRQRRHAHMEDRRETLTRQDARHVNHPHFESFVDQFQRDSQYQLHDQVAHDVLHTVGWTRQNTLNHHRAVCKTWIPDDGCGVKKCFNGDCFPGLILKSGYFSGQDGELGYITELSMSKIKEHVARCSDDPKVGLRHRFLVPFVYLVHSGNCTSSGGFCGVSFFCFVYWSGFPVILQLKCLIYFSPSV